MPKENWHAPIARIRTTWNETKLLLKGPLTDKKIADYERRGYYSQEFREARREAWARKAAKRARRDGNWLIHDDGRKVYAPV